MTAAKKYTTTEQIDQRFVWLDKEIAIAEAKGNDAEEPNWRKFKTRAVNLRHQKTVLAKRRQFLLTPELI